MGPKIKIGSASRDRKPEQGGDIKRFARKYGV